MISMILIFSCFFLFNIKSFFFLSSLVYWDSSFIMLISICSLVLLLIINSRFSNLFFSEMFIFDFLFFLVTFLVFMVFCSFSWFYFIFFLECSIFIMMLVIFYMSKDYDKIYSFFFMFLLNTLGSLPFFYYTCTSLYASCSLFNFYLSSFFLLDMFSFLCFILMLICKLPLIFFHFWLTKAHVSASGNGSMLLASLMIKLGSLGLLKFSLLYCYCSSLSLNWFFSICLLSSFIFSFIMLRFFDIKYLIACSSILHMAFIFPLCLLGGTVGVVSSVLMMAGHGLISYYLFFLISLFYESSQNRSFDFNKSLESVSKSTCLMFVLFMILNLGFPPFINFFSELLTCSSLFSFSLACLVLFFVPMVSFIFFTLFFILKISFMKGNKYFNENPYDYLYLSGFTFLFFSVLLPILC